MLHLLHFGQYLMLAAFLILAILEDVNYYSSVFNLNFSDC